MKNLFLFFFLIVGCASPQKQDVVNCVDVRARPIPWVDNIPLRVYGETLVPLPEANPGECVLMIVWAGNDGEEDGEEHPLGMSVWTEGEETSSTEYGRYNFAVTRIPPEVPNENLTARMPGVTLVTFGEVYFLAYKVQNSACNRGYYSDQE